MHPRHRISRRAGIPFLCALFALSGCRAEPTSGTLAARVAQAKRDGKHAVSFSEHVEAVDGELHDLIRSYAIVSARPSGLKVATTLDKYAIYTWNVYRDVEVLSRAEAQPSDWCRLRRPSELRLETGEIAVPRGGGSATVDGVDISMTTNQWIPEAPDRRYVVFAVLCPDQVMLLPLNGRAAFEVDERGILSTAPSAASFRYQHQAEELGTLKALLEYRDKVMAVRKPGEVSAPRGG